MKNETLESYMTILAQHGIDSYSHMSEDDRINAGCLAMAEDRELLCDVLCNDANLEAFLTCQYGHRNGRSSNILGVSLQNKVDAAIISGTKERVSEVLEQVNRGLVDDIQFDEVG